MDKISYRIEDFENNPAWKRSLGEKLGMVHFRNGHYHAECDPKTGFCTVHYDKDDPHESPISLVKHMTQSPLGALVLGTAAFLLGDEILNEGKARKYLKRQFFS